MLKTQVSPWPSFTSEEAGAISGTLLSNRVNYWTGSECRHFEREFADWTGVKHAVAFANGTLALEAALKSLAIGNNDEVIVTPRSFIASVSCVITAGGRPVFADVDSDSQGLTEASIRAVLTARTRAIVCVHLAGMPCDMDPIMALAKECGLAVVEDCAQAHGAMYRGRMVGSIGHIGAWSFCQDKIMTTGGEGGMITTNDPELWSKIWSYKDHGKSSAAVYERTHPTGFRWLHESFGTNARMIEIQAAIGRIQLRRMPAWTALRARNATKLAETCRRFSVVRVPQVPADIVHAYYRFYAFVRPENLLAGWTRDRIVAEIVARGVPCFQGSCSEIYLEQAFERTDFRPAERLPTARELGETSLSFLVHPTLSEADVKLTCDAINDVLTRATR
ncbi:MAG TPA: DegT/DnrJ/EryC1/StrS aminotransferase family protein [Steroidobacteraceae bacterium]|nr:DegT/DnrJ/EryC1/StrS aminotransferase family protein [Steroidobacteraceae bacterium]